MWSEKNYRPANANFQQFRWSVSGVNAIACAKLLKPFIVVKRPECDVFLLWEPLLANGRNVFLTEDIINKRKSLKDKILIARYSELLRVGVEPDE